MSGDLFNRSEPWNPHASEEWYLFFKAARKCVPEMFEDLRDVALAEYQRVSPSIGNLTETPQLQKLVTILMDWSSRYGLPGNQRVCGMATLCLWCWSTHPNTLPALPIPFPASTTTRSAIDFAFQTPGWEFELEDWSSYEETVLDLFKTRLREYRAPVTRAAEAADYAKKQRKRARAGDDANRHFEWAALRLCRKMTISQIADHYSTPSMPVTEDAIRKGIATATNKIGISGKN